MSSPFVSSPAESAVITETDVSVLARIAAPALVTESDISALVRFAPNSFVANIVEVDVSVLCYRYPCLSRRAQLVTVKRTDGTIKAFTTLDRDLVWGGLTYSACASYNPSAGESSAELGGVSNMSLQGVISLAGISEFDLEAGLYDGAYFEVWEVPWDSSSPDPQAPFRVLAGWTGNVSQGQSNYHCEVLGPGARLNQMPLISVLSPVCRWKFADPNTCGVDGLSAESLKLPSQVVTGAKMRGQFYALGLVTPSPTSPHSWFAEGGIVRWLTGANAGAECEIASVNFPNEPSTSEDGLVTLWKAAPFIPEPGDTFDLLPGCPHTAAACKGYTNYVNFGGFDHTPGVDAVQQNVAASA